MQQGDEFEEEENDDLVDEMDEDEEGEENTASGITSLYGIPIKFVIIGGAALLLIIVFVIVVMVWRNNTKNNEKAKDDVVTADVYDYSSAPYDGEFRDGLFWSDYYQDWVSPDLYTQVSNYDLSSTGEEDTEEVSPLDDEQNTKLRALGYTGDEIEWANEHGIDFDTLVAEAEKLRDQEAHEALVRMSDSASEEFRYIIENSYFSEIKREFKSQADVEEWERVYKSGSFIVNADYVKCPTYGAQLFLKCKIASNTCVYYNITPARWDSLPNSGNIVLQVSYVDYPKTRYIVEIQETTQAPTVDSSETMPKLDIIRQDPNVQEQPPTEEQGNEETD